MQEYAAREITGIQPGHGDRRILGTVVYTHTRKQAEATEDGLRESHQISPNIRGRNYRVCIDGRFSDRPVRSEQSLESPAASGVVASAIRIPTSPSKNPTESSRAATFRILRGANRSRTYVSLTRPTPERLNWAILKPQRSSRFLQPLPDRLSSTHRNPTERPEPRTEQRLRRCRQVLSDDLRPHP